MEPSTVSVRDLRNHGGDVVARVRAGETLTVTHAGLPVARIVPVPPPARSREARVAAWRRLPPVDAAALRRDVDAIVDQRMWPDAP
jgi:prevent-host-death family protein